MPLDKEEMKAAFKEVVEEWLDKQFQAFGRWSLYSIVAVSLVALTYFVLSLMGWKKI